jgi:hypothetical protein
MRPLLLLALFVAPLTAQQLPGAAKPRLELADSSRRTPQPPDLRPSPRPVVRDTAVQAVRATMRSGFVRRQTLMGALLYAPSFAVAVSDRPVPMTAGYLVMAGGTFFAAVELSRQLTITPAMELLATVAPLQGAAIGAAAQYAMTGKKDVAPGLFVGSVLGTTGALTLGRRLTTGAATASIYGANAAAALAMGTLYAFDEDYSDDRTRAGVGAGAAVAGMQLGAMYATYAPYHITDGDLQVMWTTALIGAAGGGAFIANGHPGHKASTLAMLGGGITGAVLGDRLLVRRIDHTPSQASFVGVSAVAGALMGSGIAVLVGSSARFNGATAGLGALGATGGVWMAERWLGARPDAGRRSGVARGGLVPGQTPSQREASRLTIDPQALALAATKTPGTYSLVRFTF